VDDLRQARTDPRVARDAGPEIRGLNEKAARAKGGGGNADIAVQLKRIADSNEEMAWRDRERSKGRVPDPLPVMGPAAGPGR